LKYSQYFTKFLLTLLAFRTNRWGGRSTPLGIALECSDHENDWCFLNLAKKKFIAQQFNKHFCDF